MGVALYNMTDARGVRVAPEPFIYIVWLFMLGALFVLVTLLLPKGIVGTWNAWRDSRQATGLSKDTDSAAFEDGAVKPHMAE